NPVDRGADEVDRGAYLFTVATHSAYVRAWAYHEALDTVLDRLGVPAPDVAPAPTSAPPPLSAAGGPPRRLIGDNGRRDPREPARRPRHRPRRRAPRGLHPSDRRRAARQARAGQGALHRGELDRHPPRARRGAPAPVVPHGRALARRPRRRD